MVTKSWVKLPHGPLTILQRKMFSPGARLVTKVFGSLGLAMVPEPLMSVHVPWAGKVAALPLSCTLFNGVHHCWSSPALAAVWFSSKMKMLTWSEVTPFAQGPLSTVHWKMFSPTGRFDTVVVELDGLAMVPPPETSVHCPVAAPFNGVAVSVAEVFGVQNSWSLPAKASAKSTLKRKMLTVSVRSATSRQLPLKRVHTKMFSPKPRFSTAVFGLFGLMMSPLP